MSLRRTDDDITRRRKKKKQNRKPDLRPGRIVAYCSNVVFAVCFLSHRCNPAHLNHTVCRAAGSFTFFFKEKSSRNFLEDGCLPLSLSGHNIKTNRLWDHFTQTQSTTMACEDATVDRNNALLTCDEESDKLITLEYGAYMN